jgi:hypothetical protein
MKLTEAQRAIKAALDRTNEEGYLTSLQLYQWCGPFHSGDPMPPPVREFQFCAERAWRFDFCWPAFKLAVEIDGKIHGGRHTRPEGFGRDHEKINAAVTLGWRVLRFTRDMIKNGDAAKFTFEAMLGRSRFTGLTNPSR